MEIFLDELKPTSNTKILDVGYNDIEYSNSDNYIEKHYQYPENITALGINEPVNFSKRYPTINAIKYDGIHMPFSDKQFDIGWSNAVIEHVGDIDAQLNFIKEIVRVSKIVFLTTPNKYFLFEVHTRIPLLHMLPKPIFDRILVLLNKKWATGDYMHLLSIGDMKRILRKANISNYTIIKNKLLFLTLDFIVIIKDK